MKKKYVLLSFHKEDKKTFTLEADCFSSTNLTCCLTMVVAPEDEELKGLNKWTS